MGEREHRKKRLTPEQKWQIFLEASRKNTTDAEVCRRWGIQPHQLRVIRERDVPSDGGEHCVLPEGDSKRVRRSTHAIQSGVGGEHLRTA